MSDMAPRGSRDLAVARSSEIERITQNVAQLASIMSVFSTPPVASIERLRGAWGAIGDDLRNLQRSVLTKIDSAEPFIAELNVEVAIGEWEQIGSEACQFEANARGLNM
jgi:hypothetical protein